MKKLTKNQELEQIAKFVYESGIHSKTPRSGFWFLGTGDQSIAEHLYRATMIAIALAYLTPKANKDRVIFMALVHDFSEGRTSDLNYVHQRYGRLSEATAVEDLAKSVPFGKDIELAYKEEQDKKTLESKLVKDADQLEWIATLREEETKGNAKAKTWAQIAIKRLKTEAGKDVGKYLMKTHPDSWWFEEDDKWFVDRDKKDIGWNN